MINERIQSDTIQIDLQKVFSKLLSWWWLFLLCFGISYTVGYFYLKYATFKYATNAVILIKDAGKSQLLSEESILLSQNFKIGRKAMDNEVQILRSSPLMERVVERLGLNVSFYRQGQVKEQEFYKNAPIILDTFHLKRKSANFFIELFDNTSFLLKTEKDAEDGIKYNYGVAFETALGYFNISTVPSEKIIPGTYRINIQPTKRAAARYAGGLRIERVGSSLSSSLLQLRMKTPVPQKAEDILSTLITVYNEEEIRDENKILKNTLDFIDARLLILEDELNVVEGSIETFRRRNSLTNETASSSRSFAVTEMRNALHQISQYEVEKTLLSSVEALIASKKDSFQLLPTSIGLENSALSTLLNTNNSLVLELDRLMQTASPENPVRQNLEKELLDTRALILESIRKTKADIEIPLQEVKKSITALESSMQDIPSIEKGLLEQKRLQGIKETIYLTLLQKREETALSIAIATARTRIIEPPKSSGSPVEPKKRLVNMASLLLGIFVPLGIIIAFELLNTKISSEDTIKRITTIPIFGRIAHNKTKENVVVKSGHRSAINEMFRQLRTNLNYLDINNEKHIFAVTSYVPGEGKSFIALNLALTYALSKKKVILLELDLRKPKLKQYLAVETKGIGITNYLVGENTFEDIIGHYEGLDFICSGPIPPNPSELIGSKQMEQLIETLKDRYDCIIIDNPPIGLVSDALLLRKFVDNLLIVVRHKYSKKFMLRNIEEMNQNGDLPSAGIILNGIKYASGGYYGYGGYRYGYGQGYYE